MKFRLIETCEWLIEASSPAEATALWLDKAEECAEFNGVTKRELLDDAGERQQVVVMRTEENG